METPPDVGGTALRAGRYMRQIGARIERGWRRPRSPVNDVNQPSELPRERGVATADDQIFSCRVQIRQDARGNVQEVLLLDECSGTEAWRHSLINAIKESSPLPAPPIPSAFATTLNMTFEARAYGPGSAADEFDSLEGATALAGSPPTERLLHKTVNATGGLLR